MCCTSITSTFIEVIFLKFRYPDGYSGVSIHFGHPVYSVSNSSTYEEKVSSYDTHYARKNSVSLHPRKSIRLIHSTQPRELTPSHPTSAHLPNTAATCKNLAVLEGVQFGPPKSADRWGQSKRITTNDKRARPRLTGAYV